MKQLLIVSLVLVTACARYPTKEPLRRITQKLDPSSVTLEQGFNSYVQRAFLEDGTEVGIIRMADGSTSEYWFRSHHLGDDMGGTWFAMSDGETVYMAGWFCCEVQLPKEQFESLAALRSFIHAHDGIAP